MKTGNWKTGRKGLNGLTHAVEELVKHEPLAQQQRADRIACITRFLNAQHTRTFGTQLLPVKELRLLHAGAMLYGLDSWRQDGTVLLDALSAQYQLTDEERRIFHSICLYETGENRADAPLYVQAVVLAECYDRLKMAQRCSCAEVVRQLVAGQEGEFAPALLTCLEKIDRELRALHECEKNHNRILLLQKIYRGDRRYYWLRKRAFDVVVASLGLLVLSPVLALIALIIYLDDPKGSPFFKQIRVGRHKKEFRMYKFRTMYMDAEERKAELQKHNEKDGPVFKMAKDPRITRVGGFLRKTSLDELPQLFNVLKGEMTLVGPRPPIPSEVVQYTCYDEMRLSVTPGLTCVWQVQPRRDDIRFPDWVDMDLKYIGTRSLWLDIKLLIKTVIVVIGRSGS